MTQHQPAPAAPVVQLGGLPVRVQPEPGLPVLEIVRVGRSAKDEQPIEVTMYVIPSDRVETFQVLHRDESAAWPWPNQPDGEPGA